MKTQSVLQEACTLLGWQGGTIHQVKAEILKLEPMERGILLNKLYEATREDIELFRHYMAEYNPLRTAHLKFTTL